MKIQRYEEFVNEDYYLNELNVYSDKDYVMNYIVIDPQYGDVPEDVKSKIFSGSRGQNTYKKYYPGDGFYKPLSDHKDPSKAIFFEEKDKNQKNPYAYEIGSDLVSDWLFSEGFKPNDKILFLIWW